VQEIVELKRQGLTVSDISELIGHDRKATRKYLQEAERIPIYGP
jgi:hypothetical protein